MTKEKQSVGEQEIKWIRLLRDYKGNMKYTAGKSVQLLDHRHGVLMHLGKGGESHLLPFANIERVVYGPVAS